MPEPDLLCRLEGRVAHSAGSMRLDVEFVLKEEWTVLFGPSGSGKSTLLRILAGLVEAESASVVRVDSPGTAEEARVVFDCSKQGVHLPAERRRIGFAGQRAALFPHLSVFRNLEYGLRGIAKGEPSRGTDAVIGAVADLFRIGDLLTKAPRQLSGGEGQRVNLARACVTALSLPPWNSRLLLLDEPLNGLDLRLRDEIVADLKAWTKERRIPVLSVTHDVSEVFQLGAEVLRLSEGKIIERGPAETVLAEDRRRVIEQLGS